MAKKRIENPFRIHGVVEGEFFTDREQEIDRFRRVLTEPATKLLVSGYRRMGKTSALSRAVAQVNAQGGRAVLADLSTASTVADMSGRILAAAGKVLGKPWTTHVLDVAKRLQGAVKVAPDLATGAIMPSLELGMRQESLSTQQASLAGVLDTLNDFAEARRVTLGVVLDEFQEITRFGPTGAGAEGARVRRRRSRPGDRDAKAASGKDQPEWHLRGVIEKHQHVSYVLAGSKPSLLLAMTEPGAAFYNLLDRLRFGPIPRDHMAAWIDHRMTLVELRPAGAGTLCVEAAGPRTRDIVRLARKCVDRAGTGAVVDSATVLAAFAEIVDEEDDKIRAWWESKTGRIQNVLRAVAGAEQELTGATTRRQFGLSVATGTISNMLGDLVDDGALVRSTHGSTYVFDDPFVRGWVVRNALPDVGLGGKPITYAATQTSEYD